MAIFSKINFGLSKTRNKMAGAIDDMLDNFDSFEDDLYMDLEEILVMSDVGVQTAVTVVEELKQRVKSEKIKKTSEVKKELQSIIADLLYGGEDMGLITMPSVILVIGVNGAGKTTTIGKMASMYKAQGKKVILGAADTFRAAAIDQLDVWAQRADVEIIKHPEGADPAAVVYDTIKAGVARECDIIIIDTAGRLHNKKNLMDELNKIYRVTDKELPYADREVLLVLDATTGQNAVNQAREFAAVAELTGIVLTKLDGTARGGVVLSIKNELKLPVKFIGVGEGIDDLQPFDPAAFAKSLFVESNNKEEDKDGNSLDELINSEDYKNYKPDEENTSDTEEVRRLFEEAFAVFGDRDDDTAVNPTAEGQNIADQNADDKGQKNPSDVKESTKANQENTEKADEVSQKAPSDNKAKDTRTADKEQKKRIEAERIAVEKAAKAKAEAERIAAEKAAKEKAEAERIAAEKAAKEKAEAERIAAEKAAKEKAEAERIAAEKAAKEKAEAERLAAERAAKEKAEAERLAAEKAAKEKEEAERKAREKAERIARELAEAERELAEEAEAERRALEEAANAPKEDNDGKKRRGLFGFFNRHS